MAIHQMRSPLIVTLALVTMLFIAACSGAASSVEPTPQATTSSTATFSDEPSVPEVVQLEIPLEAPSEVPEELKAIWEAWALLVREHVDRDKLDPAEATAEAIRGIVRTLNDPHTHYVAPEAFEIQNQDLQGEFEGIGASVSMRLDGKLVVVAPIEGSPAKAAGIRPGDIILEVDGESIEGLSLLAAVSKIRGPRGSLVKLLVQHLGAIDPVVIEIVRGIIPLESVLLRSAPGDRIAHIRLTEFFADTADDLTEMLNEVIADGAEGLIIDVRDNPGGLLQSVIDVVNLFLDAEDLEDNALVLYEIDANNRRTNFKVDKGGVATDIPMVILANEFSASASEILAGALQDHERATIVGATTFGKGSVNILRRLSNGGGLVITFARWYTPMGRLIQDNGLVPDVEVTSRDRQTAETIQLEKAIEVLEDILDSAG
ncbi:MAG: S41 family peptidase [Chloroflexi bacterium]|nr:S41 family peptidase [Chloroflexota bacterium]